MIYIESKRKKVTSIERKYPGALIIDVTSTSNSRFVQLSPFYPHGGIPVPFSPGYASMSVEGIWQGLKVFQKSDVDLSCFSNATMRNIKRTVRRFGMPLGHRKGVSGTELLGYLDARFQIYLPSYLWVLQNKAGALIDEIRFLSKEKNVVFLDYDTNSDCFNEKKPVSHASLIKFYIEDDYPTMERPREPEGQLSFDF